jgi:transcriptional regulator with XRE-family HTH domain
MSMGKLERLADLSHPTIRDICRNPYKEVTTTMLAKLATALGVSISDLFEEVPDERSDRVSWDNAFCWMVELPL